jgi:hypothetical protein
MKEEIDNMGFHQNKTTFGQGAWLNLPSKHQPKFKPQCL